MKLIKILVALLVMAAMAVPVIAEDRLSLSGQMRVRGWHTDFDNLDSTQTWADQRLRVGGKIAVAEGVSITFRTDITESNWGTTGDGNGFGSGRSGANQQWDRAHIDLTKGNLHVRAGQMYKAYGKTYALDSQDNGISVDYLFGDVPVNVFFLVQDENEGKSDSDAFLSGAKVSPKFGDVAVNFFVGNYKENGNETPILDADGNVIGSESNTNDADVTLIGVDVTIPMDAFKLVAELDFFTGDSSEADALGSQLDAYGTQLYLDGSMAVSDAFTLGGQFFWAEGDDEDIQYTGIGNRFGGWDPVYDVGTSLSNEQITFGRVFNIAEIALKEGPSIALTSAGVVGARLYTSFKASKDLSFGASAGYFESEEDKIADVEVVALAAGLVYKVMENTSLQLQLQYTDGTLNETQATRDAGLLGDTDFDSFRAGSGLFVNF